MKKVCLDKETNFKSIASNNFKLIHFSFLYDHILAIILYFRLLFSQSFFLVLIN